MEPTWFSGESICVLAQMRLNNVEKKKKVLKKTVWYHLCEIQNLEK